MSVVAQLAQRLMSGNRYTVRADHTGAASIYRDDELMIIVASPEGATELADLLERAERLLSKRGTIGTPATFQRRKIAAAIVMAMGYRLETDTDRKARLERERDELQVDRFGATDPGPHRDRLMEIEAELAALRTPLTFAAGFA